MNNIISENIYKLRKQNNLTQQQLSKLIGISIAAISKWETGVAYPDIELLPKIATIFNVSIDYIFNYHLIIYDSIENILETAKQAFDIGEEYRALSMLSDALLRYPNNMIIKFNRARMMIYSSSTPPLNLEKTNTLLEAVRELQEVINYTESREVIEESYYLISMSHTNLNDFDKALDALTQIHQSSHINTGLALFRIYLEQGNINAAMKQFQLNLYLSLMNIQAHTVWTKEIFSDDFENSILFYEMAIATFKAYSCNNSCRFDVYISTFYENIASIYAESKEFNKSIHSLKLAVEHAISFDSLSTDNDLPQFDRLNTTDTAWSAIRNQKFRLLNLIESKIDEDYKELSAMSSFIDIIKDLKNSLL